MIGNERDFVARGMISTSAGKWYSCIEDDPFSNQYFAQEHKEETETAAGHAVELWTGDSYRTLSADLRPHACAVWLVETVS